MLLDNPNSRTSMVNPRGRVIWVYPWEVQEKKQQGCRTIINPKEEYYPNLDQSVASSSTVYEQLYDTIDIEDVLDVEEV